MGLETDLLPKAINVVSGNLTALYNTLGKDGFDTIFKFPIFNQKDFVIVLKSQRKDFNKERYKNIVKETPYQTALRLYPNQSYINGVLQNKVQGVSTDFQESQTEISTFDYGIYAVILFFVIVMLYLILKK